MRCLDSWWGGFVYVLLAGAAHAQQPAATVQVAEPLQSPSLALREIDDPHSGARWLLVKDAAHPGGPGHLMQVGRDAHAGSGASRLPIASPIIHAGDRILVEEHTDVADAVLEAVALGPAVERGVLEARLKVGGRVVRVIALAPRRAGLAARTETRP
jgi:hypothetical protein